MFNLDESAMLNSNTGAAAALDSIVRVCRRQARKSIDRNMVPYYQYVLVGCYVEAIADWLDGQDQPLARSSTAPLLLPKKVSLLLPVSLSQLSTTFFVHHFSSPVYNIHTKSYQKMPHIASIDLADWRILHQTGAIALDKISINNG